MGQFRPGFKYTGVMVQGVEPFSTWLSGPIDPSIAAGCYREVDLSKEAGASVGGYRRALSRFIERVLNVVLPESQRSAQRRCQLSNSCANGLFIKGGESQEQSFWIRALQCEPIECPGFDAVRSGN